MSGFFAVASDNDCVEDLFYGTDYHLHLGTAFGGLVVYDKQRGKFRRDIKKISKQNFQSQFEDYLKITKGNVGIGVISDYEEQPLMCKSSIGDYFIAHVGKVNNLEKLAGDIQKVRGSFSEMTHELDDHVNPTELVGKLISQGKDIVDGIQIMQNSVEGSSSVMLLTREEIYLARDRYGRTPLIVGKKDRAMAATFESHAFLNQDFITQFELNPGEIGRITPEGYERLKDGNENNMQICTFLWVYYGYPASIYQGRNVEIFRNRDGELLAEEDIKIGFTREFADLVVGIPDSGIGHSIGYANRTGIKFSRAIVKYTPSWPRSFMPQDQEVRDMVARKKLLLIPELIEGKRIILNEDSIVRGTQLKGWVDILYDQYGAKEIHMRPGCPPLIHKCKFLNFSRSGPDVNLAARKVIQRIERGKGSADLSLYADESTAEHKRMVDEIREDFGFTTLRYQTMGNMVSATGLPKEKLCTYCWDGCEGC